METSLNITRTYSTRSSKKILMGDTLKDRKSYTTIRWKLMKVSVVEDKNTKVVDIGVG